MAATAAHAAPADDPTPAVPAAPVESRPPAILVIGRAIHPPWNEGTRVTARNLARAAAGLAPTVVVSVTNPAVAAPASPADGDEAPGARPSPTRHVTTSQPYGIRSDYAPLARLLRTLEKIRPRAVGWVAHLVGAPLVLAPWARLRGGRVVAHVTLTRQSYQGSAERFRAAAAWRVFDRWIDAYACASPAVRDDLIQMGRQRSKVHVVPPGIDTSRYSPGSQAAARAAMGWRPDEFVVAYIGTVSPIRFPTDTILDGLRLAAGRVTGLRLEIFAPVVTHAYNLDWAETNVRDRIGGGVAVGVHLGDLTEDEKVRVYRAADALLLPFAGPVAVEPPLTLLEGMAAGAVALVTPAANRSGIVREGITGFTWASPEDLGRAVDSAASMPPGRRTVLRAAAVAAIEREYSLAATSRGLVTVWRAVEGSARHGRGDRKLPSERRRGVSVAIVGPDGAGKTTLVRALAGMAELDALPIYLGVDRQAATHALPTTRWLARRREGRAMGGPDTGPAPTADRRGGAPAEGGAPRVGTRRLLPRVVRRVGDVAWSIIATPHELAEFGYRLGVGWRARRAGRTVLFDRFVTDSLVDAAVDGVRGWRRLRAKLLATLGRADLLLVLDAPGEVLYARKGEHDPRRLERLRREQLVVAGRARRVAVIDATQPPHRVLEAALEEIDRARAGAVPD